MEMIHRDQKSQATVSLISPLDKRKSTRGQAVARGEL
jgi:hypothetical protein